MNKKGLINFITSFLSDAFSFYKNEEFVDQYEFEKIVSEVVSELATNLREKKKVNFHEDGGADKEVVIFEKFDFVLKIPKVSGKREIEIYESAVKNGFGDYFVETKEIFETMIGDKVVIAYLQKKINFSKSCHGRNYVFWDSLSEMQRQEISNFYDEIKQYKVYLKDGSTSSIFKDIELAQFLYFLNETKRNDFINFVLEEKINDLHSNNFIYYPGTNKLLIFDYSGYDSSGLYEDEDEDNYDDYSYSHIYPSDYRNFSSKDYE